MNSAYWKPMGQNITAWQLLCFKVQGVTAKYGDTPNGGQDLAVTDSSCLALTGVPPGRDGLHTMCVHVSRSTTQQWPLLVGVLIWKVSNELGSSRGNVSYWRRLFYIAWRMFTCWMFCFQYFYFHSESGKWQLSCNRWGTLEQTLLHHHSYQEVSHFQHCQLNS